MAQQKRGGWATDALGMGLLFVAYVVTARLGLLMDAVAGFATLVWPPTGIALSALILFGWRLWPGILAGALCVNLVVGASLPVALGIATGNTLEALAGAWLLRAVARFEPGLQRLNDVLALVLLAAIGSTAISASVGVLSLRLGDTIAAPMAWPTFRAWWLGDMLGDLVVAPLLLVWIVRPPLPSRRWQVPEAVLLAAALAGYSLLVFGDARHDGALLRQSYMIFPLLLWAVLRFAQYGAVSGVFLVSAVAIGATAMGLGPFVHGTLAESLLYLQAFLGVVAVTALVLAAAIAERSRAVAARDEFLAIASHELRTPLTALLLHLQNQLRGLRRSRSGPERDESLRQLESTQRLALRLGKLIGELLDVSRIAWGRLQPEREDVDLATLVQDSLARLEEQLAQAACPVHLEIEGAVRGRWDPGRLDPVDQARVFERFERAVSRKHFGGFGLGLWLSRKIVEAHGGSIRLASERGAGSTFSVELPR